MDHSSKHKSIESRHSAKRAPSVASQTRTENVKRMSTSINTQGNRSPKTFEKECQKKTEEESLVKKRAKCFETPAPMKMEPCSKIYIWQRGKYVKDDCGSGIVPNQMNFHSSQNAWCNTPLSMYQATIGELGRQLLCGETKITKDVKDGPPCNVCEYVLPLCRGYYRKYDCIRPCEDQYVTRVNDKLVYRDRVQRYWQPCMTSEEKIKNDIRAYAPHNAYLGEKLRRAFDAKNPCW